MAEEKGGAGVDDFLELYVVNLLKGIDGRLW